MIYSPSFIRASDFTIRMETAGRADGWYTNDQNDPGGETKWGICARYNPGVDIKRLTRDGALEIFHDKYWVPCSCEEMPPRVAIAVFDCAVIPGPDRAIAMLQEAAGVSQDGLVGQATIRAAHGMGDEQIAVMLAARAKFFATRKKFDRYGDGWLKRMALLAMEIGRVG